MRRITFLLPLILLASPACTTLRQVATVATTPTPLGNFTALDNKARYAAEALYNIPTNAYRNANERGLVSPAAKAVIKPKLQEAGRVLLLARSAYRIGDLTSFNARYSALMALKNDAMKLIPKGD